MLVLNRKIGERILIEPGIEIAVVDVRGGKVRIGIVAPESVRIRRDEIAAAPPAIISTFIPATYGVSSIKS